MAEPPTPNKGWGVSPAPLLLLLEDAIDAAELGRGSAMVELSEGEQRLWYVPERGYDKR
jgi:hypothetical protein